MGVIINYYMRRFVIFIFLFFLTELSLAMPYDTLNIADVWVKVTKVEKLKNQKTYDSTLLVQLQRLNLQQFLQENSTVQFKTYGVSGSSLMSIRGANASQSKVVWNGLSLGSPMLNMNDVSILPIQAAEEISIFRGGSSAEQGSGALSGYVNMSTKVRFNEENYAVNWVANSLSNQSMNLLIQKSNSKLSSSTKLLLNKQLNKYEFANYAEFNKPIQQQLNSELNQWAIIQSNFYKFKNSLFESHFWYQENDRNLSPPLYNRNKSSYQLDQSFRGILKQNTLLNKYHSISNSIAYTRETIRFVSRITLNNHHFELFNSFSYFDQIQLNSKWKFEKQKFKHELSANYVYEGAYVEDYGKYRLRNRVSIASASSFVVKDRIIIDFNNRIEKIISYKNAGLFASSLQANYILPIIPLSQFYVRISKNYNLPGLNDLYWSPGGNPNLNAEHSFEKEIGLSFTYIRSKIENKTQFAFYHSVVDNWILWQPSATENGFWTPQNLKQVNLQGVEIENEFSYSRKALKIQLTIFYTNNLATNMKSVSANDLSVGKQLIYVPQEKYGINLRTTYNRSTVMMKHHFVSHRFTTTDNMMFMPSYHLFDIQFQQEIILRKHRINTQLFIDNIFNKSYESIPFQIMPARVFGVGFNYLFNKKEIAK